MRNIKLVVQYDGSAFQGWQRQRDPNTVQQVLEEAIASVTQEAVRVHGAGRTDAGVHALGQVAHFFSKSRLAVNRLVEAINARLPPTVSVKRAREMPADFHARHSAKGKVYRYTILNGPTRSPLERHTAWWIRAPLNATSMQQAASILAGTHDFRAFCTKASGRIFTTRTLRRLVVRRTGCHIYVTLEADGFLYNMARAIVGTLVQVGRGRIGPQDVSDILDSGLRPRAGPTAPAHGLCLMRVLY